MKEKLRAERPGVGRYCPGGLGGGLTPGALFLEFFPNRGERRTASSLGTRVVELVDGPKMGVVLTRGGEMTRFAECNCDCACE